MLHHRSKKFYSGILHLFETIFYACGFEPAQLNHTEFFSHSNFYSGRDRLTIKFQNYCSFFYEKLHMKFELLKLMLQTANLITSQSEVLT